MSQVINFNNGSTPPAPGTVLFLEGDLGGPVGPDGTGTIEVITDNAGNTSGATFLVDGDPVTFTLTIIASDTDNNTQFGFDAGNTAQTGSRNTAFGTETQTSITTGSENTSMGYQSLNALTTGSQNTAVGFDTLSNITTGDNNTVLGIQAGSAYLSNESANLLLDNTGVVGDNQVTRIGSLQTTAFMAGINGNAVVNPLPVVIDAFTNQLAVDNGTGSILTLTGDNGGAVSPIGNNIFVITNEAGVPNAGATVGFTGFPGSATLRLDVSDVNANTTIGLNAGNPAVSGSFNTSIGASSLDVITTGNENTAVGYQAGRLITSGTQNSLLGRGAGDAITTGATNTFLGYNAGGAETNGNDNTAIGASALLTANGTTSNTAVGVNSLRSTTSGVQNVAVGSNALFNNTSGGQNVGLGISALSQATTASQNTGVGEQALTRVTTGASNSSLGAQTANNLLTGSYNIAIGAGNAGAAVFAAGNAWTGAESSNIAINSQGVIGESNTLRIGQANTATNQGLTRAFICGIDGVNVGSVATVVTESGNQLGTAVITAGVGVTVTAGANIITISATGADLLAYTNVNTTPYVVAAGDEYIGVDASVGPITLQFPNAPATGRVFVVKDFGGFANTNNITLTSVGGAIGFDGSLSYVMNTQYAAVQLLFDGTNYQLF